MIILILCYLPVKVSQTKELIFLSSLKSFETFLLVVQMSVGRHKRLYQVLHQQGDVWIMSTDSSKIIAEVDKNTTIVICLLLTGKRHNKIAGGTQEAKKR